MDKISIKEFPNYTLYSDGRIYNEIMGRFIGHPDLTGLNRVKLFFQGRAKWFTVDELVVTHFLNPPTDRPYAIRHINGDRSDSGAVNLDFVTTEINERPIIPAGWKQIPGYRRYIINEDSDILALPWVIQKKRSSIYTYCEGGPISQRLAPDGYVVASLFNDRGIKCQRLVHRLVMLTFDPIEGYRDVNHKNTDKTDNRRCNLEWCTKQENNRHAKTMGLIKKGHDVNHSKLAESEAREIKGTYTGQRGELTILGGRYGISKQAVRAIVSGKNWKYLE